MLRWLVFSALLLFANSAKADLCLVPVIDGQPTEEPEISKPYLMANDASVIAGYPHVLIKRSGSPELYTIQNDSFEPLVAEFQSWSWGFWPDTFVLPDGRTIGFGGHQDKLFELKQGAFEFTPIAGTEKYRLAHFDKEAGVVRYLAVNGMLMELTADGVTQSALPQARDGVVENNLIPQRDLLPRYVAAMHGYLAIDDEQLLFLGQNADAWVSILAFERNAVPFDFEVTFDPLLGMAHLYLIAYNYTYFASFDVSEDAPEFVYLTHNVSGSARVGDSILVKQRQYYKSWWGGRTNKRAPFAKLFILRREGANDVLGLSEGDIDRDVGITTFLTYPEPPLEIAMVRLQQGRMIFDGEKLIPAPQLDALPLSVWPVQINGQNFLTNSKALFRVGADLSVTQVALPTDDDFEVYTSQNFGGAFFSHRWTGDLFFTPDLITFEPVRLPSDVTITEVKADLPDAPATLAVGSGGLYLIQHCEGAD